MAEYKARQDGQRHATMEKARTKMMTDFEKQRQKIAKDNEVQLGKGKFVSRNDSVENKLKHSTVGLVQLEDFQRIREELEEQKARVAANTLAVPDGKQSSKKKKKKKPQKAGNVLSFNIDEEDDNDDQTANESNSCAAAISETSSSSQASSAPPAKKIKFNKNPDVDTSFLPDRERDEKERQVREELRQEWLKEQERIKAEIVTVTYSYWDGSGHRRMVRCKKGDTIAAFLEKCRLQFHELRGISVDNMMYIKEDLIIPHHYTFYDFIINKTRGKSGPLFSFDVHEDIRLEQDTRKEKDESHAGK
ncbi:hypothetical protein H4R35_006643, partial [Dimargaris xerosporica]